MAQFIYKMLDIEENQATRVFLLLGMGFFMGIFLATLDVGATALFLDSLESVEVEEQLPLAILMSGISGVVLTSIYNFFQSRISFSVLSFFTIIFIAASILGIEWGLNNYEDIKMVYFVAFVAAVPINYLTLLIFWGSFGRIFTLRESKKIIGSIDTGQLIASIIALFSIPVFLSLNNTTTSDLLFASLIAVAGVLVMNLIIIMKGYLKRPAGTRKPGRMNYVKILRSKYVLLMSSFVIISTIAVTFVDYSFLNATEKEFNENHLPTFLSLFEATVVIFSFLFQTFVTDRIIATYGLKVALIINPILITIFTVIASGVGYIFGVEKVANEFFIFFFIIIAMSKLFIASLKDALDGPAFKLYFLPVDTHVRFDVQTKVEGVVAAFSGLIAGLLIIGINNLKNVDVLYITLFTLPFLLMWYYITTKMHQNYKSTLQETLVKNRTIQDEELNKEEFAVNQVLENEINSGKTNRIIYSMKLMEKLEPALFESSLLGFINHPDENVKSYVLQKIKDLHLEYDKNNETHQLALDALGVSQSTELLSVTQLQLEKLGKSIDIEDRISAARMLRNMVDNKNIFLLLELLRDMNERVRIEAIITARKVKRPETWSVLIDLVDSPTYGHASSSALIEAGEPALHALEMAFHKSGQRDSVMLKIIQIIGRIGGDESVKLLWQKIDYPDKRISSQVLIWLRYFNYQATSIRERNTLTELLDDDIAKTIWNLSALTEIPENETHKYILSALEEEVRNNYDHIFMLLSILYDQKSIQLVRENIESGSSEGITFAIELMDIFVENDVKPKLFPLFDDIDTIDKLRLLQIFFPREEYTAKETMNFILNRNFEQANRWTKGCALHAMAFLDDFHVTKAMVSQLFNPDYMLQETAAWVIYHKEPELFEKVAKRLDDETRRFLEDSISKNQLLEGLDDGFFLQIEMAMFMKTIPVLSNIAGVLLCDLTDHMDTIILEEGKEYLFAKE
ncbi:MAG: hypothetical protein OEY34_00960, partial [Cyclobacteriaceae bacterium]|nr:hypothetical protein [Cyclobacteriaceae bacterium]